MIALLLVTATAWSLEAPIGWTSTGPARALLVPSDPTRGEIREYPVPGGHGDPAEVVGAIAADGTPVTLAGTRHDGTLDLAVGLGTRGFARATLGPDAVTWHVVLVGEDAAASLDPVALLTAVAGPRPAAAPPTQVAAPAGGALWAATGAAPAEPAAVGPWGDAWGVAARDAWRVAPDLVGLWAAETTGPHGRCELVIALDANGRARVERRSAGGTALQEGTWAVRDDQLRLEVLTGAPLLSRYTVGPGTLSVVLDQQPVLLVRRR